MTHYQILKKLTMDEKIAAKQLSRSQSILELEAYIGFSDWSDNRHPPMPKITLTGPVFTTVAVDAANITNNNQKTTKDS